MPDTNEKTECRKDLEGMVSELKAAGEKFGKDTLRDYYLGMRESYSSEIKSLEGSERALVEYRMTILDEAFKSLGPTSDHGRIILGQPVSDRMGGYFKCAFSEKEKMEMKVIANAIGIMAAFAGAVAFHEFFPEKYSTLENSVKSAYHSIIGR